MSKVVLWLGSHRTVAKEEGPLMTKHSVEGEENLLWAQPVLIPLAFFVSALLATGLLALVFDTLP
jgi:hypothetical protein